MRIVIADDEQVILDGISTIIKRIEQYHIDIYKTSNGEEALGRLKEVRPHLAIIDINMPKMNGLEVIENATKWNLCKRCIILTGYDQFEYVQKALRYGAKDYLLKPVKKDYLIDLIEEVAIEINEPRIHDIKKELENIEFLKLDIQLDNVPQEIKDIVKYINNNYSNDISLSYIADILGKHPNYISSLFKKYVGVTFSYYLQFIRLRKAAYMLTNNSEMSIKDISFKIGYQNPREFFKIFKKRMNMTPSQFREIYSGNEWIKNEEHS